MKVLAPFLILLSAVVQARTVAAQHAQSSAAELHDGEDDSFTLREAQGGEERELGGHRFIIPAEFGNAFMGASLALDQGLGLYTVQSPEAHGRLFVVRERIRLALGLGDRIAIEGVADGVGGVAGNVETLLALAGLAKLQFGGGAKARVVTLKDVGLQLTAGLAYRYSMEFSVSPAEALANLDDPTMPTAQSVRQALKRRNESYVEPSVTAAWGNGPIGLQVAVKPAFPINDAPRGLELGAGLGLDFGNEGFVGVPLALAVEYNLTKLAGADAVHEMTTGLFYSGKRDLQLGVRYGTLVGMPGQRLYVGTLNLAYFF